MSVSIRNLLRLALTIGLTAIGPFCGAGEIYVNSSWVSNVVVNSTQANAVYRMSHSQYDQQIANGTGGASLTANLGNNSFLNNRTFDFTLEHRGGTVGVDHGFVWRLSDGTTTTTRSWGTFSPAAPLSAATLGGVAPGAAFNSIEILQQATRKQGSGSSLTLSNLSFSGAGLTVANGAFINGTVTTPGGGTPAAPQLQRIVADVNLANSNWMLTGKVTGFRDFVNGDHDAVMMLIRAQQIAYTLTTVPEPGSLIVLALGTAGVFGYRRFRHSRTRNSSRAA